MKDGAIIRLATCPKCGRAYTGHPALSRTDNETLICPDCGVREALESIGIEADEREHILDAIHRIRHSESGGAQ